MELFAIEILVRGVALCLLTALTLLLFRRSAAIYRHLICTLALIGLLVLPLAGRLFPPLPLLPSELPISTLGTVESQPAKAAAAIATATSALAPAPVALPAPPAPVMAPVAPAAPVPPAPPAAPDVPVLAAEPTSHHDTALLLLGLWALGTWFCLTRLAVALSRLSALTAESWRTILNGTEVLVSDTVGTPLTWGIRRPVILLPAALLSGDRAIAESALRHEQAHIERCDWLWHLLAEVVCALYWFQPGAWWLRRRLRAESERACDDHVLLSGVDGPDYATHLLEILRAGRTCAFAPGMAHTGVMESRLHHILDTRKARRAEPVRLGIAALLGVALLPLAALRVAARTDAPLSPPLAESTAPLAEKTTMALRTPPPGVAIKALNTSSEGVAAVATPSLPLSVPPTPTGMATTRSLPMNTALRASAPAEPLAAAHEIGQDIPLKNVIWWSAREGLEAGILLTIPGNPNNWRIPFNSLVTYKILVRNTSEKNIEFIVRLIPHKGLDAPYLIPSDNINEALSGVKFPIQFRAVGSPENAKRQDPAYVVNLSPGESVIVPNQLGLEDLKLFIGDAGNGGNPTVAKIKEGMNWIVQPLEMSSMPPAERTGLTLMLGLYEITRVDRNGKMRREGATRVLAPSGSKIVYARIQLEVGTLNAAAERNAGRAIWGKVDKGLQCGIRPLNPQRAYAVGDTLEAELLWRNVSNTGIKSPLPRTLDLYPIIRSSTGREMLIDFGARFDILALWHTFQPGEIRSLGVIKIKLVPEGTSSPKSNMEPGQITLPPGLYNLSGVGGVSATVGGNPESGKVKFRVVADKSEADH